MSAVKAQLPNLVGFLVVAARPRDRAHDPCEDPVRVRLAQQEGLALFEVRQDRYASGVPPHVIPATGPDGDTPAWPVAEFRDEPRRAPSNLGGYDNFRSVTDRP